MLEKFISDYKSKVKLREDLGIPPLPLNEYEVTQLVTLLKEVKNNNQNKDFLMYLFTERINPSVGNETKIKADFLEDLLFDKASSSLINKEKAIQILGTMLGGYNIAVLIKALDLKDENLLNLVADTLGNATGQMNYIYDDEFNEVAQKSTSNKYAKKVIEHWANATWFKNLPEIPEKIKVSVFKVEGETNTDDLSPAPDAFTRPDIPLHALAMYKAKIKNIDELLKSHKEKNIRTALVGDVIGTGSSRKSATNSVCWHFGQDIPYIPNKKRGPIIIGSLIAPIFYNTNLDSGCLPIQMKVDDFNEGDEIELDIKNKVAYKDGKKIQDFELEDTVLEAYKAGGRLAFLINKKITQKAREFLKLKESDEFIKLPKTIEPKGYTLAQKMIGKACGKRGVSPNEYCEPKVSTVGSQDTTGGMTRDEIKELACLKFGTDLFLQTFCHTIAYPKKTDIELQRTLPSFITSRGGIALRPGDGVIHSWLNRMMLPDTIGTGGDSHTRFPMGASFPGGSGIVAFAGATGYMPLDMPESVLVRFKGKPNKGIKTRDIVNAIPYFAIKQGLVTIEKQNKKNIFNGRIMEIEGLEDLPVMEAFEITDSSAERSCAGCVINLNEDTIKEHLNWSIKDLENMIPEGYADANTIQKRVDATKKWLANPTLLRADKDAEYKAIIEIDLADIKEPILACPNDPDKVYTLSEILANKEMSNNIDEVFIGSCMTRYQHFVDLADVLEGHKNLSTKLWISPPTRMDAKKLKEDAKFSIYAQAGARIEIPGCSLCMGNQARVAPKSVVLSTSTRNFDNRLGDDAKVYLGSAAMGGICAILGRLPSKDEYMEMVN